MKKYYDYGLILIIFLSTILLFSGCTTPSSSILSADIEVIDWEQNYYQSWDEWSDLVQVWYKITNTGNVDIDYYKIWFTAYCKDGTSYEDWTNGLAVDVGHYEFDTTFINLAPNKEVVSISVTDYKLKNYYYW